MNRTAAFLAGLVLVGTAYALLDDGLISGPARVIDGDTLQIDDTRIRLWGIDAPERATPLGPAATAYLRKLTYNVTVTCHPIDRDKYGRVVAQCFVMGRDLARDLIAAGHARDMPHFSKGYYAQDKQNR